MPGRHHPRDRLEEGGRILGGKRINHVVEKLGVRVPEQGDRAVVADAGFGVGTGDKLVKNGERVAHGAAAGTDDELKHPGFDGHVLFAAEFFEVGQKNFWRYQPERVVVGA